MRQGSLGGSTLPGVLLCIEDFWSLLVCVCCLAVGWPMVCWGVCPESRVGRANIDAILARLPWQAWCQPLVALSLSVRQHTMQGVASLLSWHGVHLPAE